MQISNHFYNFVELFITNSTTVYDLWFLWNKLTVWTATEELKNKRGHLPFFLLLNWSFMKFGPLLLTNTSRHFQLFWKRFATECFKMVQICTHKSFAYYQLNWNKNKFSDYISESFLRKWVRLIVGILPFPVNMTFESTIQRACLGIKSACNIKLCISTVWKYENVR